MTVHRPHPYTGEWAGRQWEDPGDAILWDDCDRCAELAKSVALDPVTLRSAWRRRHDMPRTFTEGKLFVALLWMERTVRTATSVPWDDDEEDE